jgi:uncharacterized protein (TIGR03083 family)
VIAAAYSADVIADAARIPAATRDEGAAMASVELARFLALLETLTPEGWERPTDCGLWNVRQSVAHQAGVALRYTSWANFRRLFDRSRVRPYFDRGMSQLDAMNQVEVDEREGRSTAELLAELRAAGPRAVDVRRRVPSAVRALRFKPGSGIPGWWSVGYFLDVIVPRDIWSHRLDVARATGRPMELTPGHDGRMTALVVRELAPRLGPEAVVYELGGPAGGTWRIGGGAPVATIRMEALDFHRVASERLSPADAFAGGLVAVWGDENAARRALESTIVAY